MAAAYDALIAEAVALQKAGRLEEAEAAYRRMLAAHGERLAPVANLATVLRQLRRWEEAEALLRRAIGQWPDVRGLRNNLGNLLYETGDLAAAAAASRAELALDPDNADAQRNLARSLLGLGEFAEGWRWMQARPDRRRTLERGLPGPEWRGEPLAGKRLLVWPEQGFGDQLMMMRYIALVEGTPVLACQPELWRLYGQLPAERIRIEDRMPAPAFDYWTMPFSLPAWIGRPAPAGPYFTGAARTRGGIGLALRGNALPDPGRSLPDGLAAELLAMPGARSLLPQDSGAADFQATADIVAGLDLVISIDTSVAHLAGAMGRPVWLLLQDRPPEWRWRADAAGFSVWYPSVRVLPQPAPGDWRGLVDRVKADWPR